MTSNPRDLRLLDEIQQAPVVLPDAEALKPLLPQRAVDRATALDQWEQRRTELRSLWQDFLGVSERIGDSRRSYSDTPDIERAAACDMSLNNSGRSSTLPRYEILESENLSDVTRQLIRYQTEPGWTVEAYLLRPAESVHRLPGVIVFHSTVPQTIRQPAGIEGEKEKAFGWELARRGYVALCPRCFLWQRDFERFFQWHARRQVWKLRRSHSRTKGITKMLSDAQVGLDLLANLPEVDPDRLGTVGHSLGGKQALYLTAWDDRIRAAVSSEGGIGRNHSNWSAPWYLGRDDTHPEQEETGQPPHWHPDREHHELLGLIAPRAFLLVGGDSADGAHSWPFIEEAMEVYRLYDQRAKIGLYNHRQGHTVPQDAAERIYQWFDAYL